MRRWLRRAPRTLPPATAAVRCSAHTGAGLDAAARGHGARGASPRSSDSRASANHRSCGGSCRRSRWRSASWCARRKAATPPPCRGMFELPEQRALIDSPGVRDFAPAVDRLDPRSLGFVEVGRLAGGCRFHDCRHMREPDCAVRARGRGRHIPSTRRYESYRRLRRLLEKLTDGAARGGRDDAAARGRLTPTGAPRARAPACHRRRTRAPRRPARHGRCGSRVCRAALRARPGSARLPRPRRWSWWRG